MTTTPNQPEPARTKTVQPPPAPRAEVEMRRPSRVGRFFSRLLMLALFCAASFVGGYYVMDQEAQLHRDVLMQDQAAAHDRIAALEEQIREMQLSRLQENSVEIDLTEVFAPIREAVSRLAEAQMTIVARQISAEIAQRVDADVQNLNTSAPLAAIAETAAAALTPAVGAMPPGAKAEAPPEPVAELAPAEPPGDAAAELPAVQPDPGPAPDGSRTAPGNDAAEAPAGGERRPAAELSGRTLGGRLPSRVPQWLSRLADSLENAGSRLDATTATPPGGRRLGG